MTYLFWKAAPDAQVESCQYGTASRGLVEGVYKKAEECPPAPNNGGARGHCGLAYPPIIGG